MSLNITGFDQKDKGMKFNQLRDFVAVSENGSLRGAARALGLAQPAITRSIQELEHVLGAQLFIREARGVRLTSIGETFLVRAMFILSEIRRAREAISQELDSVEGELVVGLSMAGHLGIFGEVLQNFQSRYPKVRLRVIEGFLPTLEADLRNGLMDLYVGPVVDDSTHNDLHVTKLFDNRRVVIGRKGHPLSNANHLSDLQDAKWTSTSITHEASDELMIVFAEHDLPQPNIVCQCQSGLSLVSVLVNSDILAMTPVQCIESPLFKNSLVEIELGITFPAPSIKLVRRIGIGLTPAGEYFAHLVEREASTVLAIE